MRVSTGHADGSRVKEPSKGANPVRDRQSLELFGGKGRTPRGEVFVEQRRVTTRAKSQRAR
jgi:hypothetical protein